MQDFLVSTYLWLLSLPSLSLYCALYGICDPRAPPIVPPYWGRVGGPRKNPSSSVASLSNTERTVQRTKEKGKERKGKGLERHTNTSMAMVTMHSLFLFLSLGNTPACKRMSCRVCEAFRHQEGPPANSSPVVAGCRPMSHPGARHKSACPPPHSRCKPTSQDPKNGSRSPFSMM